MLLEVQILLRCWKEDGAAVSQAEIAQVGLPGPYEVTGLELEEQAAIVIGCSLKLDSFKGRLPSDRFFQAIEKELKQFTTFLTGLNVESLSAFKSDLLLSFKIDEDTMDFEIPSELISAAAAMRVPVSILVDPEGREN